MSSDVRTVFLSVSAICLLLAGAAGATDKIQGITGDPDNPLKAVEGPFTSSNAEGDFTITWPSGCNGLRQRMPRDEDVKPDQEYPVMVFCDRNGETGEGCSVAAIFNVKAADGGLPGPGEVLPRLESMLKNYGAQVVRQAPISKDFGGGLVAEGLDVQAAQQGGSGQVWLRGMVAGGVVYILAAWDLGGDVWENPEYQTFFNSFLPRAD